MSRQTVFRTMDSTAAPGARRLLTSMAMMNRPTDHQRTEILAVSSVSAEDMTKAGRYMLPDRSLTVLIGDASVIVEPLQEAGFSIEMVELPD